MSKGTFFGNIIRNPFSFTPQQAARDKVKKENAARDATVTAAAEEKAAAAKVEAGASALDKRQKAKQVAAINTPSRGFGSNSLENLSRSFLLRL